MKINNISKLNLYGYKNIIVATNIRYDDKDIIYLSAQLNDEGKKDLSKLLEIRKLQGLPENSPDKDIFTLFYYSLPKTNKRFFGAKELYWGEELRDISDKYIPKVMSAEEYKKQEAIHLKIYTLLASLTKRMKNNNSIVYVDSDITKVYNTLKNNIFSIIKNKKSADTLASSGCLYKFPLQEIAGNFNKGIRITMERFFR